MGELMSDRLLDVGSVLMLAVPRRIRFRGHEIISSRIYFFKVGAAWPFYWEYDKMPAIPAKSGTSWGYFGEDGFGEGDDILRIERDDFHCYHIFVTPDYPDLRVFRKLSTHDTAFSALDRKKSTDLPNPKAGTNVNSDFYDLKLISAKGGSKWNPSSDCETLVIRVKGTDEGKTYQWAFYNPANSDIPAGTPVYILGRAYKLLPITDRTIMQKLLSLSLRRKEGARANRIIKISLGDLYKGEWRFEGVLPKVWDEVGCFLELTEDVVNRIDFDLLERDRIFA